jgi:hypothetical protein
VRLKHYGYLNVHNRLPRCSSYIILFPSRQVPAPMHECMKRDSHISSPTSQDPSRQHHHQDGPPLALTWQLLMFITIYMKDESQQHLQPPAQSIPSIQNQNNLFPHTSSNRIDHRLQEAIHRRPQLLHSQRAVAPIRHKGRRYTPWPLEAVYIPHITRINTVKHTAALEADDIITRPVRRADRGEVDVVARLPCDVSRARAARRGNVRGARSARLHYQRLCCRLREYGRSGACGLGAARCGLGAAGCDSGFFVFAGFYAFPDEASREASDDCDDDYDDDK